MALTNDRNFNKNYGMPRLMILYDGSAKWSWSKTILTPDMGDHYVNCTSDRPRGGPVEGTRLEYVEVVMDHVGEGDLPSSHACDLWKTLVASAC